MTDPYTEAGKEAAARYIAYASEIARVGTAGLMDTFTTPPPKRSLLEDYGYELGGLCSVLCWVAWLGACFIATVPLAILGVLLLISAFALCWWYG